MKTEFGLLFGVNDIRLLIAKSKVRFPILKECKASINLGVNVFG